MKEAVATLNKDIENIRQTLKEHNDINLPASTLEKREAERKMIEPCVKIANAMYVIGFMSNNKDLITLHGLSEYSFYRLSDNASLALARRVLDTAHIHALELKTYGISEDEITHLKNAIDAFHTLIAKPMDTIGERKQKTTNLAQLFAILDSTFYDRLDKLMVLFKQTNIDFYSEYRTARNIIFNHEKRAGK